MGRNRVLVVSARCGRVIWAYVLRGLIEAGKSMAPYGPGAIAELYELDYDGHPDRWTPRLTLRERRLWRALEDRLRGADAAPAVPPAAQPATRPAAQPATQPVAQPATQPVAQRATRPAAGTRPPGMPPAGPGPGTGWQAASDKHEPPR